MPRRCGASGGRENEYDLQKYDLPGVPNDENDGTVACCECTTLKGCNDKTQCRESFEYPNSDLMFFLGRQHENWAG